MVGFGSELGLGHVNLTGETLSMSFFGADAASVEAVLKSLQPDAVVSCVSGA